MKIFSLASSDKEQELDLPTLQVTEAEPEPSSSLASGGATAQQKQAAANSSPTTTGKMGGGKQHVTSTMSRISGVRKLKHANSLTSPVPSLQQAQAEQQKAQQLLRHGVDTATPNELSQLVENIDRWGIDVFKLSTLSANRPLTCVAYTVLKVRDEAMDFD